MSKISNYIKTSLIVLCIAGGVISLLLYFFADNSFDFLTGKDDRNHKYAFSDKMFDNGSSEILAYKVRDSSVYIQFKMGEKFKYPYAGFSLGPSLTRQYYNFEKYDSIFVDIKTENARNVRLVIKTVQEGSNERHHSYPVRYSEYYINTEQDGFKGYIPLSDFKTPEWWFLESGVNRQMAPKIPNYKKVVDLSFFNSTLKDPSTAFSYTINEVRIQKSNRGYLLLCISFFVGAVCIIVGFKVKALLTPKQEIQFIHSIPPATKNPLGDENREITTTKLIETIIGTYYMNPGLTLKDVAKECAIAERDIAPCLKENTGLSFKQYLNKVRVDNARYLLTTTNEQVGQIGLTVGFNSFNNFTRVFKSITGQSPKAYRENALDTNNL